MSTLNDARGTEKRSATAPVTFSGRDRVHATRVALDFWFHHRAALRLSAGDFLSRCQLSSDERTVIFLGS